MFHQKYENKMTVFLIIKNKTAFVFNNNGFGTDVWFKNKFCLCCLKNKLLIHEDSVGFKRQESFLNGDQF